MKISVNIKASVLSTVIVMSVLMLLAVFAIVMIWEVDFVLFSRTHFLRIQQDNIRSTLVLYCAHPEMLDRMPDDSTIRLYNSGLPSEMILSRKAWGLYEMLTVSSVCGTVKRVRVLGLEAPLRENPGLWCRNNNSSITISGRTTVEGTVFMPDKGVVYKHIQSIFFSGIKLDPNEIKISNDEMLRPINEAETSLQQIFTIDQLRQNNRLLTDSIVNSFSNDIVAVSLSDTLLFNGYYSGNIILKGGSVRIDPSVRMNNVIIVADKIIVAEGVVGSAQLFARDTIIVENNVVLKYPSGCYSEGYGEIGDQSQINGYFIVNCTRDKNIKNANFKKSRISILRGLLYVNGTAHVQGILTGSAFVDEAIIYSPYGYYRNLILDLAILRNNEIAYPLWLDANGRRKEAIWVD